MLKPFEHTFKDYTFWRIGYKLRCRHDFNAVVFQCFLVHSRFVLVARKTVKLVYEYHTERSFCAVFNHTLEVWTVVIRTCHSAVYVGIEYEYIVALCVLRTYAQLSVNALLGLAVARIATIDNCCFHFDKLLMK